jgi:DNA-binding CsgD family transcriptional regulator
MVDVATIPPYYELVTDQDIDFYVSITARRAAILALVVEHRTQREIAKSLGISPHTVRSHIDWLRGHTSTRSMAQLGRWWGRHRASWVAAMQRVSRVEAAA